MVGCLVENDLFCLCLFEMAWYSSCSLDGFKIVTCGEDGSVIVWQGTEFFQSIPHPKSVWAVCELPNAEVGRGSDIVTAGHDGIIRIFTADEHKLLIAGEAAVAMQVDMNQQVEEAAMRKRRGPSSDEIEKAAKWEQRGSHSAKSDGHVSVIPSVAIIYLISLSYLMQTY